MTGQQTTTDQAATVEHHIEERAVVYLRLEDGAWTIDSPTDDGYPLQGYDHGPLHEDCDCGLDDDDELLDLASKVDLPDARQLLDLLAEYLGCTVTENAS